MSFKNEVVMAFSTWAKRNAYRILLGKPKERRALGRPRHRWKDNIKMDLRGDGVVWTGLI
jgi:hypothetical protein